MVIQFILLMSSRPHCKVEFLYIESGLFHVSNVKGKS